MVLFTGAPVLSRGAIAIDPIDSDGIWSVSGFQLSPPSSETHTPPLTVPA